MNDIKSKIFAVRKPKPYYPTNNYFYVIIALGRLGDYEMIDSSLLKRELDPRPRKKDFVKKL